MAPVVALEQEDDLSVGGCFDFRARFAKCSPLQVRACATVLNLGENQFIYVSETHIKLISGGEKARFCVAMARLWRIRTSAASQSM